MKSSNRWNSLVCLLASLLGLTVAARHSYAGAYEVTSNGQPLRWSTQSPISYLVNPFGGAGLTTDLEKLLLVGAVDSAFHPWANIQGASIQFSNGGTTSLSGHAVDGNNVISFLDPDETVTFPPGVIAVTVLTSATSTGTAQLGNTTVNVDFVGQILDADILFNPTYTFSIFGTINTFDVVTVLEHEIGHLLGLDHSAVLSSIMDPFTDNSPSTAVGPGVSSRALQTDDMITAATLYPNPSFSPIPAAISGTLTNFAGGPQTTANVAAISVPGGVPVASQLSGADGSFSIAGLPAGNYQIMTEPLDGPVTPSNFPGYYSSISVAEPSFPTTFLGGLGNPTTLTLTPGQTAAANIALPALTPNLLTISAMSANPQSATPGTLTLSPLPLYLPRGNAYQLSVIGNNLAAGTNVSFSAPSADITPQGATTAIKLTTGQTALQQNISVSATATLGPSNLSVSNPGSTYVTPGGLVVTLNPTINNGGVVDAASFQSKLAPGSLFSIFGTDLATRVDNWQGPPAPTSLGGVSVKVADRFAPLFFASPGQINGMIPIETTGSSAEVTVIAGPNAASKRAIASLAPIAPAIFSAADSSGAAHGVILNSSDNTLAAPAASFPGNSHPARPGDVVIMYASGLGPVAPLPTPACTAAVLPSGVGAGANGTCLQTLVTNPQILIGGKFVPAANIQFAGLAPNLVGLYQVNLQLPANVSTGNVVPVQIVSPQGQASNIVVIAVSQ